MTLKNIQGILFDLDDTLFDCTGQLTGAARERAASVLVKACPALQKKEVICTQETLSQTLGSAGALKHIAQEHTLPTSVVREALEAYNLDVPEPITPFPETHPTLAELKQRGYKMALVTTGRPARQRKKVEQLHLTEYFNEQNGTLVIHDDQKSDSKSPFLELAAQNLNMPPQALMVVGDKLTAEIAAGNTLGMTTTRIRHGRQKDRIPQCTAEQPHLEIDMLSELLTYLP